MVLTVFVIRHRERLDRVSPSWQEDSACASDDSPLSAHGRAQAHALAARLAPDLSKDSPPVLLSSPFQRCVGTAAPLAAALGQPIRLEPGLCEHLFVFPPGFRSPEDLRRDFPAIDPSYVPVVAKEALGDETGSDGRVFRRVKDTLAALLQVFADQHTLILFTHQGSGLVATHVLGSATSMDLCSVTKFVCRGGGDDKWSVELRNDVSHLAE